MLHVNVRRRQVGAVGDRYLVAEHPRGCLQRPNIANGLAENAITITMSGLCGHLREMGERLRYDRPHGIQEIPTMRGIHVSVLIPEVILHLQQRSLAGCRLPHHWPTNTAEMDPQSTPRMLRNRTTDLRDSYRCQSQPKKNLQSTQRVLP